MAKRARREPTSIVLTVRVDLHEHWTEREIREEVLPPRVFDALAEVLAAAIAGNVADVEAVTVGEPARRNFATVIATAAHWRKMGALRGRRTA